MKKVASIISLALAFTGACALGISAQVSSAKAIIRAGQPGIAADIIDSTGRVRAATEHFSNGEQFRLRFTNGQTGYIYLINVSPSGQRRQIFPRNNEQNTIVAGSVVDIPNASQAPFQFDNERGMETIEVAVSPTPIGNYETARDGRLLAEASVAGISVPQPEINNTVACGGFANSNSAKAIIRPDGYTFQTPMNQSDFFRCTIALFHE